MKRQPVRSASVASLGYDPRTKTLEVEFTSGAVYRYFGVSELEYQRLLESESIGRHLNQAIRNAYPHFQL
jgi:hypothetical protein